MSTLKTIAGVICIGMGVYLGYTMAMTDSVFGGWAGTLAPTGLGAIGALLIKSGFRR
ncbi:MAG TPA: hypothetical protein VGE48_01270 [Candidatus Paceibacterota bacterium]